MFKALKDNKIIGINKTDSFPLLECDEIVEDIEHDVEDYVHCDGQFVLTNSAEAVEQYKANVRKVRDDFLEQTDKYLSITDFPITDEERELYKQYRTYLRDYTLTEDWWKVDPKTFEQWFASLPQE